MSPVATPSLARPSSRVDVASVPAISEKQMRMVLDVSRMLAVPTGFDELLCQIVQAATVLLECERASIFLHDERTNELWTKVALHANEIRIPCTKGIAGHCFNHGELICVNDPYNDSRFNPEPDRKSNFVTRNLLTAPLLDPDGRPLGVIQAVNSTDGPFGDADHALIQLLAEQAGVAVHRQYLQARAIEDVDLHREMDLARATQQALIPKHPPKLDWADAAGWNCASSVTGGDCWDMWVLPDGRLGIFLADASGNGIGPALVVSQARTLARALSEIDPDPHRILRRINARLVEDLEADRFVMAFLAFLGPDGWLHWSSAGHGPAFIRNGSDETTLSLESHVEPLGVVAEWDGETPIPFQLAPGASLVVISDGIFESATAARAQFGLDRLKRTIETLPDEHAEGMVRGLCATVENWREGATPIDDQTIVAVRYAG
jgi:sigma-B regulation protein RsbU (phosphoserine phosphatase)